MAVRTCWLVHGRIAYSQFIDVFSAADFEKNMAELEAMFAEAIPLTHFITDGTLMTESQFGPKELFKHKVPKASGLGWTIFVDPRKINRFFGGAIAQLAGSRNRQFATLAEALSFLQENDETLPDLSHIEPAFQER